MRQRLPALLLALLPLAGCAAGGDGTPGGTVASAAPTATESRVGPSLSPNLSADYRTSDYEIRRVEPRYYDAEKRTVDLDDPAVALDASGAVVRVDNETGETGFHPVGAAQHGLFALAEYDRGGSEAFFDRAEANAQALIDNAQEDAGAWWWSYDFDFALGGEEANTIVAPWWSGMAQGQALSLFVRMYEHDGDEKWREAADKTFASFFVEKRDDGPWFTLVDDGHLWFEEYAGNTDPLLVINGHNFALFGLYDYYVLTGDERAERFFDAGATTMLAVFDDFREPGGISHYCVQEERCLDEDGWPSAKYHMIHIQQLEMLADITGDARFDEGADLLRQDFYDPTIEL